MKQFSDKMKIGSMLVLMGIGILYALFMLFGASAELAESIVRSTGYFFTAVTTLWFLYFVFKTVRFKVPERRHLFWLVLGVVLSSAILTLHEDFGPKVAWDDYVLSATAKSLAYEREVEVLTHGGNFNDYFYPIVNYVDKRPWLYPFAVSVLHDLTGFRVENAYWINLFFTVILLGLTAAFAYRVGGLPAGLMGPVLWASLPLASQNAMGGGLDMLNLLLLLVVLMSCLYYIKSPDAGRLSLLSLATVLTCYARYESIIFWGPVLLVVLLGWYRVRRPVLSFAFAASPALLIALAALLRHIEMNESLWELRGEISSRFGFEYIIPNLQGAIFYLWNFGDELSNSILLGLVGLPCLIFFILRASKSIQSKDRNWMENAVLLIFAAGVLFHFLIIMSYFDGQLEDKVSSRFSLPLYLLLIVSIIVILSEKLKRSEHWWLAAVVITIFMLGFSIPNMAKGIYSKRNFVVREAEWLIDQAEKNIQPMSLIVDRATIYWTLMEWQCITPKEALFYREHLREEWEDRKFPEIYLVDRLTAAYDEDSQVRFDSEYDYSKFEKTLVAERSFSPLRMTRLYKVDDILLPEKQDGAIDDASSERAINETEASKSSTREIYPETDFGSVHEMRADEAKLKSLEP